MLIASAIWNMVTDKKRWKFDCYQNINFQAYGCCVNFVPPLNSKIGKCEKSIHYCKVGKILVVFAQELGKIILVSGYLAKM